MCDFSRRYGFLVLFKSKYRTTHFHESTVTWNIFLFYYEKKNMKDFATRQPKNNMQFHQNRPTIHICVTISSNTPPASSAASFTSFTFHALASNSESRGFRFNTCSATCLNTGSHGEPLKYGIHTSTFIG